MCSWKIKLCNPFLDLHVDLRLLKWSQIISHAKNMGFDTKIKSLVCSEPKLQFHSLKLAWASYSPYNLFFAFRWTWGSWNLSQMIRHTPKQVVWHLNQVSSMFRTKVIISLHEDVLGLLQPLHLVLDLQIDLRLTKMVPNDSPCQKTWGLTPKSSL